MFCSRFADTCPRAARIATIGVLAAATLASFPVSAQAASTVKVAFYNIQGGTGEVGFPGRATPFAATTNCVDTTKPLNAWGVGLVQRELARKLGSDPSVIALGLAESWVCGTPENVRRALNWKSRSETKNGLGIVARHGFSRPVTFLQLDTSLSENLEPRFILHAAVCVDAACSDSFDVFALHTQATGSYRNDSMVQQMKQVLAFMAQQAGSRPRALLGDFNVYEQKGPGCADWPFSTRVLNVLRGAGYVDAWRAIHGTAPGYTGMTNRKGCGAPEGSTYKRIDYAWSLGAAPRSMTRFGMTPPGDATYSDHLGIVAEYPIDGSADADTTAPVASVSAPAEGATISGAVSVTAKATDAGGIKRVEFLGDGALIGSDTAAPFSASWDTTRLTDGVHTLQVRVTDPAGNVALSSMRSITVSNVASVPAGPGAAGDIVLHAATASVAGRWQIVQDASAASGKRLYNPNRGAARAGSASAAPASFAELTFHAEKGRKYRLWVRGKADSNSWANDSAFVQFSDSLDANGAAAWRIGTTSSTTVQIEEGTSAGLAGWGWADNKWGGVGPLVSFATTGTHKMRLQIREDGMSIDQVVLSASTYLTNAPGRTKNDTTILDGAAAQPAPGPSDAREIVLYASKAAAAGSWRVTPDATAAGGAMMWNPNAGAAKLSSAKAAPASYIELTFNAEAGTPYRLWLRGRAEKNSWANDSVFVQFSDAMDEDGARVWGIGTTSSTWVSLEPCSGCGVSGWGWQDNGYGSVSTLGPLVRFATSGAQTIRIQVREDGFAIDQVVLSSERYLTAAPGANRNDTTVLAR